MSIERPSHTISFLGNDDKWHLIGLRHIVHLTYEKHHDPRLENLAEYDRFRKTLVVGKNVSIELTNGRTLHFPDLYQWQDDLLNGEWYEYDGEDVVARLRSAIHTVSDCIVCIVDVGQ